MKKISITEFSRYTIKKGRNIKFFAEGSNIDNTEKIGILLKSVYNEINISVNPDIIYLRNEKSSLGIIDVVSVDVTEEGARHDYTGVFVVRCCGLCTNHKEFEYKFIVQ